MSSPRRRLFVWCDRATGVLTALLVVSSVLAIGAVYCRGRMLIQMTAAVLGMLWGLRMMGGASPVNAAERPPGRWPPGGRLVSASGLTLLAILLLLPLIPLPPRVLQVLSPRAFAIATQALPGWPARAPFADLRAALDLQPARVPAAAALPSAGAWRPLSLAPHGTSRTLSLGAAYVLVAAVVAFYPWSRGGVAAVTGVLNCLLVIGVFEALYGIWGTGSGYTRVYWYDCAGASCMGSYVNRDHFAGLLEMIFLVAVARAAAWWQALRLEARALRHAPSLFRTRRHIDAFAATVGRTIGTAAVALFLLVAMAVSASRSAWGATVASLLIMVPLLPRQRTPVAGGTAEGGGPAAIETPTGEVRYAVRTARIGRSQRFLRSSRVGRVFAAAVARDASVVIRDSRSPRQRAPFLFGAVGTLAIVWLTFPDLFGKLSQDDAIRPALAVDTFNMAMEFPLFGTGLGTFSAVFPLFRPFTVELWPHAVTDAHNDYLQWLAEVGMPAALVSVGLLLAFGRRVVRVLWRSSDATPHALTRWGLAAAVLALLFHSLTDFNLHVPANALVFAVLVGSLIRFTRENALEVESGDGPGAGSRRIGGAAVLLCAMWAGIIWWQWDADAAYAVAYPEEASLTDPTAPLQDPSPEEALQVTQYAARRVPGAPQFQARLGALLIARSDDEKTPVSEREECREAGIVAYLRSVWAAPLQPDTLFECVAAIEPGYRPGVDFESDPLHDLVARAASLAPYNRAFQLTIARWYLAHWDQVPEATRPQRGRLIEGALELAARAPDLWPEVETTLAEYVRRRDGVERNDAIAGAAVH